MNVLNHTHRPSLDEIEAEHFREFGIPAVVFLSILIVVGSLGNSHILIVYGRSKSLAKRQTVRNFIMWASAIDLTVCIACMPYAIFNIRFEYTISSSETCKFFMFLTYALSLSSVGFMTAIAIQRFRSTNNYLLRTTAHQNRVLNIVSATIVIICTVLSEPAIHFCGIEEISTNLSEFIGTGCILLSDYKSEKIYIIHGIVIILIGTSCFIICVVCYGRILRLICIQMKAKTNTNGNTLNRTPVVTSTNVDQHFEVSVEIKSNTLDVQTQKSYKRTGYEKGQQLTIGLISATAMSYFGYLIYLVTCLVSKTNPLLRTDLLGSGVNILFRIYFIHNVANPVMFFLLDNEFREECLKLFKKTTCWSKIQKPP